MSTGTTLFERSTQCLGRDTPVAVRSVEIESDTRELRLPVSASGLPYRRLLALVRSGGRPLGWAALPVSVDGTVTLDALACLPGDTQASPDSPAVKPTEPLLSVVIATCANDAAVIRCVDAIRIGASGPCETIVVENRPARSTVKQTLAKHFGEDLGKDASVRYVEEHRSGLACARNAGLRIARGEIVAFTDDDVVVDPTWVTSIRAAFTANADVDCVTGMILPLELETPAQLLIERFAGYGKGFVARTYSLDDPPADQPLFPYAAGYFGSGANMAFRTSALRDLGGFDPLLGTGTPARGCEDLDICIRVLTGGGRLTYEPRAIVWHRHPDTHANLRRRVFDYGAALGAMLTKHILLGPDRWAIVSRAPQGISYYIDPNSRKNVTRDSSFPKSLRRLELVGTLYGPVAYLASCLKAATS